ncbi:MAG: peptidylprolyl isomerase [Candidatus Krumholzibacteria bacterium]|nr:peptidylprolyl isomerase [Candidatus Krumholzibacteria bacterium]
MSATFFQKIFFVSVVVACSTIEGLALADKQLVDRVIAVVEDTAIFQSEIDQTVKQLILQRGLTDLEPTERSALKQQVLDELINSKLIVAKAGRLGIDVPFAEIEQLVDQAIEDNEKTLGGEEAFARQLEAEGLTMSELKQLYREQIRNRMLVERVLSTDVDRRSVQVTEADLRALYDRRKSSLPLRPAVVHLRTVYIAMESSQTAQTQAKARADSVYRRVMAGEDFADLARAYSDDPSAKNGGRLGSLKLADLADQAFAEAAGKLAIGEVSQPVLTGYGYHLIKVTGADSTKQEVDLSHILITVKPGDDDIDNVFAKANEIHASLLAGAPFDTTAMRFSDDSATAAEGGDLGWLRVEDLPEFFRDVLSNMKQGDISPVLREPTGFRIVQLLARETERTYRYEEVQEELKKLAEQEKTANIYDDYLNRLRDEFYVDLRGD